MKKIFLFLFRRVKIAFFLGCFFVFSGCGVVDHGYEMVQNSEPAYVVNACDFIEEYKESPASAKAKYNEKVVVLYGNIVDVGDFPTPYFVLNSVGSISGVFCQFFTMDEKDSVKAMCGTGRRIWVKGLVVDGLGSGGLSACRIIDIE
jgi:hypothetical protein